MNGSFTYSNGRIEFCVYYSCQPEEKSTGTPRTFTLDSVIATSVQRAERRGGGYPVHYIDDYDLQEAIGELEERRLASKVAWAEMCDRIEAQVDEPDIPVDLGYVAVGR